ncbi:hypothetical protein AGMMS49975_27380 [Clostridia bacterium]|nr:hypothetical protein AGMMS49975_27350 [Clostridia bacterium]GHU59620.1 hypothetical protein AGMMS49975_27380 [Clostridia bacterium]
MGRKTSILVVFESDEVKRLNKEKYVKEYDPLGLIPDVFKQPLQDFMMNNVGFDLVPMIGVTRINEGEASLKNSAFDGDLTIMDLLPVGAGDVILEFEVDADTLVSIGMMKWLELVGYATKFADDVETVVESLENALFTDTEAGDGNVYSFVSKLRRADCVAYYHIDDEWNEDDSKLFEDIEEVKLKVLNKFT